MDLYQESTRIKIPTQPKTLLKKFDYQTIAFVLGTHLIRFPTVCVTIHGGLLFSRYTPVALCQQLEDEWQIYYFYTRQQTLDLWDQTVVNALVEGQTKLGQYHGPLRVATCGGYSFWTPNPGNKFGFWFFTPTCQNIKVHDNQVDFTTTDENGQITHWTGKRQNGESHLITQARLDTLADFVWRKAALTHKVALQLAGNILTQQTLNIEGYSRIDMQPMFPLDKSFYEEDLNATLDVLSGHAPELAKNRIASIYNIQNKITKKTT